MAGRVLVTGGAGGIGAAIVRAAAAAGFTVDFTYNASAEKAQALAAEVGGRALRCDLSDRGAVEAFAKELEGEADGYYGFVHNAGRAYDSLAAMVDVGEAAQSMEVNFWAMVRLTRALVRRMTSARTGRIVMIGSLTAMRGNQGNAIYAATKAAMLGYANTLAGEVARRGVTVNYVAPGFIDTEMLGPYANYREALEKQIPAARYGKPEEVAAVVSFLLSDGASYVNGATIMVDGGLGANLGIKR